MGYFVGDIPATDLVIEPVEWVAGAEEPLDLTPFDEADALLYGPNGLEVDGPGFVAEIDGDTIVVEWPNTSPFEFAGIYSLRITVSNATTGVRQRIPVVRLVADYEDGWHTLDTARDDWRDAPGYDAWLYELLWTAKNDVLTYAPALPEATEPGELIPVPINYRRAQLMQARNLWNAGKVDPATGTDGDGTFVLRPFPLDWTIKQVLRPQHGTPVIA